MFYFDLRIKNPWAKDDFKNIFCRERKFTKNKAYSFELLYQKSMLFSLSLRLNWRGSDHAGPAIELGLFGYSVSASIYDTRHWDYEKNCWTVYD